MSTEKMVVGVDVAKSSCAVCIMDAAEKVLKQFSRDSKKYPEFIKDLVKLKPALVVLEATGGYEKSLVVKLSKAEIPYRIVDPLRPRRFAESLGADSNPKWNDWLFAGFSHDLE